MRVTPLRFRVLFRGETATNQFGKVCFFKKLASILRVRTMLEIATQINDRF